MKREVRRINPWTVERSSGPSLAFLFLLSLFIANFFVVTTRGSIEWLVPTSFVPTIHRPEVVPRARRAFDGAASATDALPRFAVVIDNMYQGRPPVGVNAAGFIIEAPVEAGITRWLAFYEFERPVPDVQTRNIDISEFRNIEKIGPVRSLRPYFLALAEGYHSSIAHVGGSPEALARAKKSTLLTLNEFGFGNFFFRDLHRRDPHRVFTSSALLLSAFDRFGVALSLLEMPWTWERKEKTIRFDASSLVLSCVASYRFVSYPLPPEPELTWVYNPSAGLFERQHGGVTQRDADGVAVTAKTVFVIETTVTITDAIGRRRITTTGKGTAWRLTPTGKERLIWQREDGAPYRLTTVDGKPLELPVGRVWMTIVPSGQSVESACGE